MNKSTKNTTLMSVPFLVGAQGVLHVPNHVPFPGKSTFRGENFHSAQWPSDFSAKGKRIAVVGSAASAIQFVPHLARDASRLFVLQRTANWIAPRNDVQIPLRLRWLLAVVPGLLTFVRAIQYLRQEYLFWLLFTPSGAFPIGARARVCVCMCMCMCMCVCVSVCVCVCVSHAKFHAYSVCDGSASPTAQKWAQHGARTLVTRALAHMPDSAKKSALMEALTPNYLPGCKRYTHSVVDLQ